MVKTLNALLLPVASETASMKQVLMTLHFDNSATGPSTVGDIYSMFNDA